MTGILTKRENVYRDTHKQNAYQDKDRDCIGASSNQEIPIVKR
jgi:hypothetical protein